MAKPTGPIGVPRSHRRLIGWRVLSAERRRGPVPRWPLGKASAAELKKWREMWRLPQASAWREDHCEDQLALYTRLWVRVARTMDRRLMAELRAWDRK